jgi:hypothetical protein
MQETFQIAKFRFCEEYDNALLDAWMNMTALSTGENLVTWKNWMLEIWVVFCTQTGSVSNWAACNVCIGYVLVLGYQRRDYGLENALSSIMYSCAKVWAQFEFVKCQYLDLRIKLLPFPCYHLFIYRGSCQKFCNCFMLPKLHCHLWGKQIWYQK